MVEVYLSLGGNIGDSCTIVARALKAIARLPEVKDLVSSSFYVTTPVSDLDQPNFVNAVCCFKTDFTVEKLFERLQEIEVSFGKFLKPKNAPRTLDIDILFFDEKKIETEELMIPHPKWRERLFVLKPLFDITDFIVVPTTESQFCVIEIKKCLDNFHNRYNEKVEKIDCKENIYEKCIDRQLSDRKRSASCFDIRSLCN